MTDTIVDQMGRDVAAQRPHRQCGLSCLESSWHGEARLQRRNGAPLHGIVVQAFGQGEPLQQRCTSWQTNTHANAIECYEQLADATDAQQLYTVWDSRTDDARNQLPADPQMKPCKQSNSPRLQTRHVSGAVYICTGVRCIGPDLAT